MNPHAATEPRYQQLNLLLRQLIASGEFGVGSQFLTERHISERFHVSRATANKSLSALVSEGLLEFRKGLGTFVRGRAMDYNLRTLVSFTDEALAAGKKPATRVLRFQSIAAGDVPAEIAAALQTDGRLYHMERVRLAEGLPVIFERRWVAAALSPGLTADEVQGSLYALWTQRYGLQVAGAEQRLRAVTVKGAEARALAVSAGAPALLVTSVGYLVGGTPLWFEKTLYRGDAYEFHNHLCGMQPAGLPAGRFLDFQAPK